jgi:hypothetical protein
LNRRLFDELIALYRGQVVSDSDYAGDASLGKYEAWVKQNTPEIMIENLSAQARYYWRMYLLKRGGFIFEAEDLEPEDWEMLGCLDLLFNRIDQENLVKMIFGDGGNS